MDGVLNNIRISEKLKSEIKREIERNTIYLKNNLRDNLYQIRLKNLQPIFELVNVMPENMVVDLGFLLIKLTAFKKDFSSELSTVGHNANGFLINKFDGIKKI